MAALIRDTVKDTENQESTDENEEGGEDMDEDVEASSTRKGKVEEDFQAPAQPFEYAQVDVQDGGMESSAGQDIIGSIAASAEALERSSLTDLEEEEHAMRDIQNRGSAHEEGEEVDEDDEALPTEENEVKREVDEDEASPTEENEVEGGQVDEDDEASPIATVDGEVEGGEVNEDDKASPTVEGEVEGGEVDEDEEDVSYGEHDGWEAEEWELRVEELLPILRSSEPGTLIPISLSGLSTSDVSELINALAEEDIAVWGELPHGPLYAENQENYVDQRGFGNQGNYIDEREFGNSEDYVDERGFSQLLQEMIDNDDSHRGAPPAARTAVECLLSISIQQRHLANDGSAACAICLERFVLGDLAKQLPCLHHYHEDCLLPWLRARNSCPTCRYELPTDDPDYEEQKQVREWCFNERQGFSELYSGGSS